MEVKRIRWYFRIFSGRLGVYPGRPFFVFIHSRVTLKAEHAAKLNIAEDGIPTWTTSLKNVGLSAPERSGIEYASVGCVNLSLQ
jgi:hypothetical protein